ncbi:hypothetical protein OEA41_008839 [Lepraria neglecta]|uniref:Uncharacterized protein n=1 Tax=Lepraria neglecta TaxID=209136 RepID=A0AAD9Z0V5_9LECA|nr:hypothetical protein OEA41_008839 [Lepraria neglecta]
MPFPPPSFDLSPSTTPKTPIYPSQNGFVRAAISAYSSHHHLRVRPEDIWFAILSQLSLWINAHATEKSVREKFISFDEKKELKVTFKSGDRYCIDWGVFALLICGLIEKNVVDKELREWMMPAFSTTTEQDTIVASVLMMGAAQKFFDYKCRIMCGLPSVTLLGVKSDWELILQRLEKLNTFGEEPAQFCKLLKPVISRFVKSFDEPESEDTISFWQRIAHFQAGASGPSYYSGWITAFCFWDEKGKSMFKSPSNMHQMMMIDYEDDPDLDFGLAPSLFRQKKKEKKQDPGKDAWAEKKHLSLDGVQYHWIESDEVPPGYTFVPVKVDDNGNDFDALMVAGSVGIKASSSESGAKGRSLDTMSPESGWWIFQK